MTRRTGYPRGFTLVELLMACIVIGILALIAIPKYTDARHRAFKATLRSDLKNLATQEELYYREATRYTSDLTALEGGESRGVTVTVNEATNEGWAAVAVHEGLPDQRCGIYSGKADPSGGDPADRPGVVMCTF
jgi:prepilin-type N-terminal cleavage/methylation domain-containing protein